jgi:hypothetical protein
VVLWHLAGGRLLVDGDAGCMMLTIFFGVGWRLERDELRGAGGGLHSLLEGGWRRKVVH